MPEYAYREDQQSSAATVQPRFTRYAIFYTPRPGTALAAFGRSWFGRANDGVTLQAFSDAGLSGTSFARLMPAPGRYTRLHAPIRAAFTPRDGIGLDAIKTRLINFAARRKSVATGPLTLSRAGRYLVLRPVEATPGLDWLAAQCTACFEDFTVSPPEATREERAFQNRFSIALTGPLDPAHLERVTQALWPVLDEICASGVTVDALSLFGDSGNRSPMRLIGRYRLAAA